MRRRVLVWTMLAMLLLLPGGISYATPTAPVILINEDTHQCDVVILGDECGMCAPAAGWTILDGADPAYPTMSCPAGFTMVDAPLTCTRYREQYCCGGFSGRGDCTDLVISETEQACAFLPNERACIPPPGWSRRPTGVPEGSWLCNFQKDHWVNDLTCLAATATPQRAAFEPLTKQQPELLPIGFLALLAAGAVLWLWRRR